MKRYVNVKNSKNLIILGKLKEEVSSLKCDVAVIDKGVIVDKVTYLQAFKMQLHDYLKDNNLRIKDLAYKLGISASKLSSILNNNTEKGMRIKLQDLIDISILLDIAIQIDGEMLRILKK